jgi:cytochrome c biogenesis protein
MRTALLLLLLLGAGAAVGAFFPQRPVNPFAVAAWKQRHAAWAGLAERVGLFDVYGSWWFMAIYALLMVSLVACLLGRYRAFWRVLRARPRSGGPLARFPHYHEGVVSAEPERALAGAERVLRRRRFRLGREDGTLAGEKGHLREGGSLVFHTAFVLLLVGIAAGKAFGFSGQVAVVEGEAFTDAHVAYDAIREGRYFNERHRGFTVALDEFDVTWHANGVPKDFVSHVRVLEDGRLVRRATVRVNSPLTYRGVRVYQLAWGWAPRVRVVQRGQVLFDAPVVFLQDSRSGAWRGVVKAPAAKPFQLGLDMWFFSDIDLVRDRAGNPIPISRSPEAKNPVIVIRDYYGDLRLDRPQSVYELDKLALAPGDGTIIGPGSPATLRGGIVVSFPALEQYSVFQVASDPGIPLVLAAAVLILVGLIPALYSSRRRVWVRVAPLGDAARLEVAGQALQRRGAFEEEFRALVSELDRDLQKASR